MWHYIIRIFLIFSVGGVASVTYFDAFMPGHIVGEHPFHISIFESPHHHNPLPRPAEKISPAVSQSIYRYTQDQITYFHISTNLISNLHSFFQSGFNLGYLLIEVDLDHTLDIPLLGQVHPFRLLGRAAWLPPPDKPPTML